MEIKQNPLQTHISSRLEDKSVRNSRGRPNARNTIVFSPQPKSTIAEFLSKHKKSQDNVSKASLQITETNDCEKYNLICGFCSHRSADMKSHKKHMMDHKQFICDFPSCKYSSKLSSNLLKHKRVHTNEKPYLCEKCSFRSNFINSLKVHKRTHSSDRPYQCKHCNYKCNSSSNLKKHCLHRHHN